MWKSLDCEKTRDTNKISQEDSESNPLDLGDKNKLKIFMLDYEVSNREIERREHIMLVIGSILITGSFLMLS
ncbi:MAG: hypothetical protein QXL27_09085 [Candidatus Bathyarchaeia archaeon]